MSEDHPYSLVVERNGIAYVSGAAAIDYGTNQPVQGRREGLDAALDAVESRLASIGLGLEHVVKLSYFVIDLSLRDEANAQIVERFGEQKPARTLVEVSAIPYGASAAIDAIAHR